MPAPAISGYDLLSLKNESQTNAMELTSGNQELDDFLVGLSGDSDALSKSLATEAQEIRRVFNGFSFPLSAYANHVVT